MKTSDLVEPLLVEPQEARHTFIERPRLLWSGCDESLEHFPDEWQLRRRCEPSKQESSLSLIPLGAFVDAIATATRQISIFDLHFDDVGIEPLRRGVTASRKPGPITIRIFGSNLGIKDRKARDAHVQQAILGTLLNTKSLPSLEWKVLQRDQYPYAHDRFAIIDDQLFHFGGTVGSAQRSLTATSFGWSARDRRAHDFFDELWTKLR